MPSTQARKHLIRSFFFSLIRYWWLLAAAIVAAAAVFMIKECNDNPPVKLAISHRSSIDVTPEEIQSLRDIGQWEFLTINTEEMVQLVRAGMFSDDQLVRIYQGTLRLGIDLDRADDNWFRVEDDTVAVLRLPKVALLDEEFIDEARTRSFYENGRWTADDRRKLYEKARQAMKRRCLTHRNLETATRNAEQHFTRIFKNFGFKTVRFEP